ncbi:hypothetical protein [Duncaniella muris]|uniref:hypothetical protein n=1 Tax=Duncaniella muris TaxID=2094150 RepID=UPI0025B70617|nr:hypothetical protein [Duncaniella muris]
MKKKLVLSCCIAVASFALWITNRNESRLVDSELMMVSVEALTNGEGTSNTGPREQKNCMGGGHKMVCRGINTNPCTDSSCY